MDNVIEGNASEMERYNSNAAHEQEYDDEDDIEYECRICRGPAEEGRPLFSPCLCSGSIGLTHQDCLKSWLAVTRGDKCELCSVPFKFAPKYADNAPDNLPLFEVIAGVIHRAGGKWLPFALRAAMAITLWVCILPLATAYLYYGWIHRPSSVVSRWKWDLVTTDMVAGGIVAGSIIISFLSLMSLADVLRVHLQQPVRREAALADEPLNAGNGEEEDDEFDADIFPYEAAFPENTDDVIDEMQNDDDDFPRIQFVPDEAEHILPHNMLNFEENGEEEDQQPMNIPVARNRIDPAPQQNNNVQNHEQQEQPQFIPPPANRNENAEDRFEPQFEPMAPVEDQDDGMDIHVAIDELLGLRGPLSGLIRNLLWLLAFNTIYLGVFACFPHAIGQRTYRRMLDFEFIQNIMSSVPTLSYNDVTISFMIESLRAESERRNPILQLPDLASITLGYLTLAVLVFILRANASVILHIYKNGLLASIAAMVFNNTKSEIYSSRDQAEAFDRQQFLAQGNLHFEPPNVGGDDEAGVNILAKLKSFLDGFASIVKVGLVLFVKMLFLPLFLGLWLDFATLSLFDTNIRERIVYAGKDLFGAILIHWVFGITFMLMVTVSVLQLREVVHPDLLAKIIRPQEPQPDLMGNILQETGFTHMRRMILSLTIYVALLVVYVWFPAQILASGGVVDYLPFFQPKIFNIFLPEFQFPIELLIFHMSMLALIEKYKNNIGQMIHHLLLSMCNMMGITNFILPQSVAKFQLVGLLPVYIRKDSDITPDAQKEDDNKVSNGKKLMNGQKSSTRNIQIDPFWKKLAIKGESHDIFITRSLDDSFESQIFETGITKNNGQRVLSTQSYIRISSEKPNVNNVSVPTCSGRYRFRLHYKEPNCARSTKEYVPKIEVWKEVIGEPLFRPPDGWDDLGAGGAEVQGRWAWGKEVKSDIEEGVAKRALFKNSGSKIAFVLKMILLILFFWGWNILLIVCGFNLPLLIGRSLFTFLHLPDKYLHDPVSFVVGASCLFPLVKMIWPLLTEGGLSGTFLKFLRWVSSFRMPYSQRKLYTVITTSVLWMVAAPMMIGMIYNLCLVADRKWWATMKSPQTFKDLAEIWVVGFILFHAWVTICYTGMCTRGFWTRFRGVFEANNNGQNGAIAINGNIDENNNRLNIAQNQGELRWQGINGKIGQFLEIVEAIFTKWEWDKVDSEILLDGVLYPISKQLFIASCVPYVLVFASLQLELFIGDSGVGNGLINILLYRSIWFSLILVQIGSMFKSPLEEWFQAAHRAARDERYLIGETLLDYQR